MPFIPPPSNIPFFAASQLGSVNGAIEQKIATEIQNMKDKFKDGCPTSTEMRAIIGLRNNLLVVLNNFKSLVEPIKKVTDTLSVPLKTAKTAVTALQILPLPTSVPPGVGLPMSKIIKFNQLNTTLGVTVDNLEGDQSALNSLVSTSENTIDNYRSQLLELDINLEKCINNLPEPDRSDLLGLIGGGESISNIEEGTSRYRAKNGEEYILSVEKDQNSPEIAPRQYAVAKNLEGVIVLRGAPSFSTSKKILLDEIRFRLDNNLP